MGNVGTVTEAMLATIHAGSSMSQQVNYITETKNKLEGLITSAESIKLDIETQAATQEEVSEYFEGLKGVLATNGLPVEKEEKVEKISNEAVAMEREAAQMFEDFFTQIKAAMETLDNINTQCTEAVDKSDTTANMISDLASE
jgi:tRNA C32,U32 (ribose-2'-O)-methylase TrmJ